MSNESSLDQDALHHRLAETPASMRPHVRMGFRLLGKLAPERTDAITQYVVRTMVASGDLDAKQAQEISGLNEHTIHDVLTALTYSVASLVDLNVSLSDFMAGVPGDLVEKDDLPVAEKVIGSILRHKESLKVALDTDSLSRAVLPSFRSLRLAVDLRLKIDDDGSIKDRVPIAVAHLETDNDGDEVFFQLSVRDVERLIERLNKILDKLKIAQEFGK